MSLDFSPHGNIVSDSRSNALYGATQYIGGHTQSEIYERSMPPANGVFEVSAGDRKQTLVFRCTWFTTDPEALDDLIDTIISAKRYGTITFDDGVGGNFQKTWCRLEGAVPGGTRISGYNGNGDAVMAVAKDLIFKKVGFL